MCFESRMNRYLVSWEGFLEEVVFILSPEDQEVSKMYISGPFPTFTTREQPQASLELKKRTQLSVFRNGRLSLFPQLLGSLT